MSPRLSQQQLDERIGGIGASESAMALGLSPYGGPGALQARKLGAAEPDEPSWSMRLGTIFEGAIAEAAAERMGWEIAGFHRTLWHPNGVMFCTPDYRILRADEGLEIKKSEARDMWGDDGDPLGAPVHVRVQVQHQMAIVRNWRRVWVAVLLYGHDLRLYPIERNAGQIEHLERAIPEWWQRHIAEREPVEMDGSEGAGDAIRALYPVPTEASREATPAEDFLAQWLLTVRAERTEAERTEEELKQRLMVAIGPSEAVTGTGWRATFKPVKNRVDYRAAAEERGLTEIEAEAYRPAPTRSLRVTDTAKKAEREPAA